jgi:hypothetical protein
MTEAALETTELQCENTDCGKTFTPNRIWQKFCSPMCRDHFWVLIRAEARKMLNERASK